MTWQDDYRAKHAAEHFRCGTQLISKSDWHGACDHFRQAVYLIPDKLIFRQFLTEVTARLVKENQGGTDAPQQNISAITQHVRWSTSERHWDQALAGCERGLDLAPHDAWLNAEMGKTMHALGVTDIAVYYYERASTLDPKNEEYRRILSQLRGDDDPDTVRAI